MIDHISLKVSDIEKSKVFYLAALKPLRYEEVLSFPHAVGLGISGKPDLWLMTGKSEPTHIAFLASDRATVDAFHKAALKSGGKDNGKPGLRSDYHANYYAAFVEDPDGNNIEAVCHHGG